MARSTSKGGKKIVKKKGSSSVEVALTDEEVEIFVRACEKYKQSVPIYIESRRREIRILDSILNKLS